MTGQKKPVPKVKLNTAAALKQHQSTARNAAESRFAIAKEVTEHRPTGLSPASVPPTSVVAPVSQSFDFSACVPGNTVFVPLRLIDLNPVGPRQIYKTEEVDKIAATITDAQDDAAHGFLKEKRVQLIDGGTRYRSAKVGGIDGLWVKFEEPPQSDLDLYLRARRYNDQRSQPTAIDHALAMKRLMEVGAVRTQRDLIEKVPDLTGRPMSEAQVSSYMRISRMPERVLLRMSDSPATSAVTVLYAVSGIFERDGDLEQQTDLALQIVDIIKDKDLSKTQVTALVNSRLQGAKTRERSDLMPIKAGGLNGHIKQFARRGTIEMQLKGVAPERLDALQALLLKTVDAFVAEQAGSSTSITPS